MANLDTTADLIAERVEIIISNSSTLVAQIDEFKEWNNLLSVVANTKAIISFSYNLVSAVELTTNEILTEMQDIKISGEDKLNAAVAILDARIKLGWVGEMFDDIIIKLIIKYAVETLNKLLGNEWDLVSIKQAFADKRDVLEQINAKLEVISPTN